MSKSAINLIPTIIPLGSRTAVIGFQRLDQVDSETSSFDAWRDGVEALLREVGHVDAVQSPEPK